jgi:hypothetical protein
MSDQLPTDAQCLRYVQALNAQEAVMQTSIPIGQRVELHPGMDAWMMGDRYGVVVKTGRKLDGRSHGRKHS